MAAAIIAIVRRWSASASQLRPALFVTVAAAAWLIAAAPAEAAASPAVAPALPAPAPAKRVITLAPHITELVFTAGGGDKIVGTVNSSNFPAPARQILRVGDGLNVNAEQLLTLKPDLVIAWQNTLAMQKLAPTLSSLGIPLVFSAPENLDDISDEVRRMGVLLGTEPIAYAAASQLSATTAELRKEYADRKPVSVFIEVGTAPLYTLGGDSLTNDAIAACGGANIFAQSSLVAPTVTAESVVAHNPDVIIIASRSPERLAERSNYWHKLGLKAARRNHIYGMDPDALLRPAPRLIPATGQLCELLDAARD